MMPLLGYTCALIIVGCGTLMAKAGWEGRWLSAAVWALPTIIWAVPVLVLGAGAFFRGAKGE